MNVLHVPATESLVAASGKERGKASLPTLVVRAVGRAVRVLGRALASPSLLWWLGLPWQSRWPPSGKGGER
ncbi:MAG TPA: hypothetical protein VEQ37_05485 [Actinomycetota bacterium]|nr:hypothetical protein [Actinomycetota bacterium]